MNTENFEYSIPDLEQMASNIRGRIVQMSHDSGAAHLGSALSCVDLLTALHFRMMNQKKDRFILSKGHAAAALYATLAFKGIIDMPLLETYSKPGSILEDHPGPSTLEGVEAATGSLGHGLSLGTGMALGDRVQKKNGKIFVLLSDGECNEGSVWEAAMFASGRKLNQLTAIIDFNKWQATGRSCEISGLEPLAEKWKSFGFQTFEIDGHNMKQIVETLEKTCKEDEKPCAIIAHTIKGKGVSFMEDDNNWHYRIPTKEEVALAIQELKL